MCTPPWLQANALKIQQFNEEQFFVWKRAWDSPRYSDFGPLNDLRRQFADTRGLSRQAIIELFRQALSNTTLQARAVLGTFLWGGLSTGGKPGDRLLTILELGEPPLQRAFEGARKCLTGKGGLKEAYLAFDRDGDVRIPEVGPAYFTKILYFMGEAVNSEPMPLILDKWSGNAYAMLLLDLGGKCSDRAHEYFNLQRIDHMHRRIPMRSGPGLYDNYIHNMNAWARNISVYPARMEEWLFGYDLRRRRNENPRLMVWNHFLKKIA